MGINFGNNAGKFFAGSVSGASSVNISVIGVGGAGGNIVKYLSERKLPNVNLICANTDIQAMMETSVSNIIQLGKDTTRGLGAGSSPKIGEKSAIEASEEIKSALRGTDMLILVTGLGGGTGTGATPVISSIAKEMNILTLTFAVTPFDFELERKKICKNGINNLLKNTDSLITLSNQKLLSLYNDNLTFVDAFIMVNDIVYQAITGVVNLLLKKELINRDFSDIVQVMKNKGHSIISIGKASGENRAITATTEALTNPLLSDVSIKGASGMIITICAAQNSLKLSEVNEVMNAILMETNANVIKPNILFGTSFMDDLNDELRVSIIATGLTSTSNSNESDTTDSNSSCVATDYNFGINSDDDKNIDTNESDLNINDIVNMEDIQNDRSVSFDVDNGFGICTNQVSNEENKKGFFSEFFSRNKNFDDLKNESLENININVDVHDSDKSVNDEISLEKNSESVSFLDNMNTSDEFFSDINNIDVVEDEENIVDDKLLDSINSEKDDNILFLTEKNSQNQKNNDRFYSKQVDIFELIDSITASK